MSETAVDTVNISKSLYMMIALGLTFVYFWDILLFCKTPLFAQHLCTTKCKLFFKEWGSMNWSIIKMIKKPIV